MVCSTPEKNIVVDLTTMSQPPKDKSSAKEPSPDFHGAALLDDEGNEIPITEDMVREACKELDETRQKPQSEASDD